MAANLTSDLFAGKVFEDIAACQELCRILLHDETLVIRNVQTQYTIRNLRKHSVELDILAEDAAGSLINTELQMYKEKAPLKRSRYYLSSLDASILEKGSTWLDEFVLWSDNCIYKSGAGKIPRRYNRIFFPMLPAWKKSEPWY